MTPREWKRPARADAGIELENWDTRENRQKDDITRQGAYRRLITLGGSETAKMAKAKKIRQKATTAASLRATSRVGPERAYARIADGPSTRGAR